MEIEILQNIVNTCRTCTDFLECPFLYSWRNRYYLLGNQRY